MISFITFRLTSSDVALMVALTSRNSSGRDDDLNVLVIFQVLIIICSSLSENLVLYTIPGETSSSSTANEHASNLLSLYSLVAGCRDCDSLRRCFLAELNDPFLHRNHLRDLRLYSGRHLQE